MKDVGKMTKTGKKKNSNHGKRSKPRDRKRYNAFIRDELNI